MKVGIKVVVAIMLFGCLLAESTQHRTITREEARELVFAMLKADDWIKLPGFVLSDTLINPDFPDFCFIHADWDNPWGGSAAIGHYAVERTTGDVWDDAICGRFTSPTPLKAQQVLRRRIGLTHAEYRNLRKPGPFCEPGEVLQILKMGRPRSDALPSPTANPK